MAADAGIGRVDVIAIMTLDTVIGNAGMSPCEWVIAAVGRERSRFPSGSGGMAGCTCVRNVFSRVVWICSCIEICLMAGETICWRTCEPIAVTAAAWSGYVNPGQWEASVIMVETALDTASRMTFITWEAGIGVPSYSVMLAVHIRLFVGMAVNTAKGFITA